MAATSTYYTTNTNRGRFESRRVISFSADRSRPVEPTFSPSAFARLHLADGQALAGTGALVFEGEVLERAPR